jgi:hypothetical protein
MPSFQKANSSPSSLRGFRLRGLLPFHLEPPLRPDVQRTAGCLLCLNRDEGVGTDVCLGKRELFIERADRFFPETVA